MPTYEEADKEYRRVMGDELGRAYHRLWNECAFLHMRWEEYVELFGKSQAEFDTFNEVAPGFFKSVQDAAWEQIILHLCRFADPFKVSGRRTLSLDSLLKMPASQCVPLLKELVATAREDIKFAQDTRNRVLAHKDLEHALNNTAKPLLPTSRTQVRVALEGIVRVLEAVDSHFTGCGLIFDGTGWNWGGDHLVSELRLLSRLRNERKDRMNSGVGSPDDYDFGKWN